MPKPRVPELGCLYGCLFGFFQWLGWVSLRWLRRQNPLQQKFHQQAHRSLVSARTAANIIKEKLHSAHTAANLKI